MSFEKNKILITGLPGSGKTTLIEKVISSFPELRWKGFFTKEIRDKGERVGFEIITGEGKRGILAHKDLKGGPRVGKYGVNIKDIDEVMGKSLENLEDARLVIIDEIGKMEMCSPFFRKKLMEVLSSPVPLLGTIKLKGNGEIDKIKGRKEVLVILLNPENRDKVFHEVKNWVSSLIEKSSRNRA